MVEVSPRIRTIVNLVTKKEEIAIGGLIHVGNKTGSDDS